MMQTLATVLAGALIAAESFGAPAKQLSCAHSHFHPLQLTVGFAILGGLFLVVILLLQALEKRSRIAQATTLDTLQQHAASRPRHRYSARRP